MKVAVVGLGYWGPNLARNLNLLETCDQLVACDRDEARLKHVLRQYPSAVGTTSFDEVVADPEISAVVLATPVPTHHRLGSAVLDAGKSVLIEKPLATSRRDADDLVARATANGVLVMAGHTFLYSPPVMTINELVKSGEIGEPLYLQSSRVNLGLHQSDVSVLWDLAPHDLAIIMEWLDETPIRVSAIGRSSHGSPTPDVAFVDLEFASGFVANLHLSWLAPTKLRRMTLVGTQKMVVYEDTHPEEPVKVYDKGLSLPDPEDFGQYKLTYRTGDVVSLRIETWEPLRLELEDFLSRVERGETPGRREDTAVEIVGVIEAAEYSLQHGGEPVDLAR